MKDKKYNIGVVFVCAILVGFFMFAAQRNDARKVVKNSIEFVDEDRPFVTQNFVNKLLIQKSKSDSILTKETLALKDVEERLVSQPHIEKASVYVSVNGELGVKVKQRTPIARLYSSKPHYIDDRGLEMPLSPNFAARVPLVFHFRKKHKEDLLTILKKIDSDTFLKQLVTEIDCLSNRDFVLKLREHKFLLQLGGVAQLDLKCENFKAFYAKAQKDQLFDKYKQVNLGITNQVVCTKF